MRKILEYHLCHLYVQMDNMLQGMDDVSAMYDQWNYLTYLVGRLTEWFLTLDAKNWDGNFEPWRRTRPIS